MEEQVSKAQERTIATLKPSSKNYFIWYFLAVVFFVISLASISIDNPLSLIDSPSSIIDNLFNNLFSVIDKPSSILDSPFPMPLAGLAVLFILIAEIKKLGFRFTVTTQRIIVRKGIISRFTSEIRLRDIRNIRLQQSITQRLFSLGDIYIASAGTSGVEIVFLGISSPKKWKDKINELLEESERSS